MTTKLTCRNLFTNFIFHPTSPELTKKDQRMAKIAIFCLAFSFGFGHLAFFIAASLMKPSVQQKAKKADKIASKHLIISKKVPKQCNTDLNSIQEAILVEDRKRPRATCSFILNDAILHPET